MRKLTLLGRKCHNYKIEISKKNSNVVQSIGAFKSIKIILNYFSVTIQLFQASGFIKRSNVGASKCPEFSPAFACRASVANTNYFEFR